MKTVQVIALRDHEWAGEPRKLGETYEVDPSDVRFDALITIGHAKIADVQPSAPNPEPPSKGRYQRRDLRAKE
jgi:hypothetical protein